VGAEYPSYSILQLPRKMTTLYLGVVRERRGLSSLLARSIQAPAGKAMLYLCKGEIFRKRPMVGYCPIQNPSLIESATTHPFAGMMSPGCTADWVVGVSVVTMPTADPLGADWVRVKLKYLVLNPLPEVKGAQSVTTVVVVTTPT